MILPRTLERQLRTPITSIKGFVETMLDGPPRPKTPNASYASSPDRPTAWRRLLTTS